MKYDVIVVGAGHAGCEASLACAKLNKKTLLITGNLNKVASLPCNPSIGGPAKGIVVREIDALGGIMGKIADRTQIQIKMLNASKGPAVRALRAQVDKEQYPQVMLSYLKQQPNLTLLESFVDQLIIKDQQAYGVILEDGTKIESKAVIITTGTYLDSKVLVGSSITESGPDGDKTTKGLSHQLKTLGFEIIRLKTGTPPRLDKNTINFDLTTLQAGDTNPLMFSHFQDYYQDINVPCYLTYTTLETHNIINQHLNESAMYSGNIEGVGPRYCPSIEDKIVRFNDKERHQIFLEPESLVSDEIYVQGLSTSLPEYVQEKILKSIPALSQAKIIKYAYAIEYDAINPSGLYRTLETKLIKNLYTAGQINGTSGYEEAAGQGIIAGINASLKIDQKPPFILQRSDAYIGVLIDDLITKGTEEPYRLLTSRAEHRLLLRNDNAQFRLTPMAYAIGLINETDYQKYHHIQEDFNQLLELCQTLRLMPNAKNLNYLTSINSAPIYEGVLIQDLIKRPEINASHIKDLTQTNYTQQIYESVNIQIKYEGYIQKSFKEVKRLKALEEKSIPATIDYDLIHNLSHEAKEKLKKMKPETIGQASRILGVNPTDISLLMVYIEAKHV